MLKTFYFVCVSFLIIVTDSVRCESDYVFNLKARGWLKLHSTPVAWEEAFVKCHNEGAVLASPLNKELVNALRTQMVQLAVNGQIFLGTHSLNSKGYFTSVEGVPLSDMDIRWRSLGGAAHTGDCLTMSVDGDQYYMDTSSCSDPLPFICYKKLHNEIINQCGTFDNGYQLNQQTGSCYKIHTHKKSWARAYGICASEGSHLVIVNDEVEARIVNEMFPTDLKKKDGPWDGFHIGLRAWGKDRIWTTIHGESIENVYNKWHPGEPNNRDGIEARALVLWNGNLELDDETEDARLLMFACEKSPGLLEDLGKMCDVILSVFE